jgi:hypothetical protein
MRSFRHAKLFALPLALCLFVTAACGTHGTPPTLGKAVTLTLAPAGDLQMAGTVTFAPLAAMRLEVYYHGKQIPVTGAATPAQLRIGGCYKPIAAPLTDGNVPEATSGGTPASAASWPPLHADPAGGVDIPLTSGADRFVSLTARPNDPTAPVVDCGQPLDNKEQYFDLYPPETGSNSIATGSALVVPLSATRVTLAVKDGNASDHPTAWSIRAGSCTGKVIESGTIGSDGVATRIIYAALNTSTWQLVVTHSNGETTCYPVK